MVFSTRIYHHTRHVVGRSGRQEEGREEATATAGSGTNGNQDAAEYLVYRVATDHTAKAAHTGKNG